MLLERQRLDGHWAFVWADNRYWASSLMETAGSKQKKTPQQSHLWTKVSQLFTLQHRWWVSLEPERLRSHLKRNSRHRELFQFMRKRFTPENRKKNEWRQRTRKILSKLLKPGLWQCKSDLLKTKGIASAGVTQLLLSITLRHQLIESHLSRFSCSYLAWRTWSLKSCNSLLRKENIELKIRFMV